MGGNMIRRLASVYYGIMIDINVIRKAIIG